MIRLSARFAGLRLGFSRPRLGLSSSRLASVVALIALSLPVLQAAAQPDAPSAPTAPAPAAAPVFPKPDPANFTAAEPTKEAVNAFLEASWGYDESRFWQVQAILKTPVEGVSKVVILVGDKDGKEKPAAVEFFVLPGGKYLLAQNDILPFGEHPYAENRAQVRQRADGPYRGSASKELEIVEFADFQCPHCKDAQANMDKGGSDAFFTFAAAVFDGQEGLETADGATLTLNSAASKVGLDPAKIAACASAPATHAAVEAQVKLAQDLNINQTPMLMVNGRPVPANAPYDSLKKIIEFQARMDGVTR